MDRERLVNLLEAVRSVRAGVLQMEQELLSALTADQVRRDARESQYGNTPDVARPRSPAWAPRGERRREEQTTAGPPCCAGGRLAILVGRPLHH